MLLGEALRGAKSAGAIIDRLGVGEISISGCNECNDCYVTGECTIVDDMSTVYQQLETADRIIVASPIFFMGLPSQLKAVIDRCQQYWAMKYALNESFPREPGAPERYGAYIGVGGTRGDRLFDGALMTLKYFFDAIAVKPLVDDYVLVKGIDEKGEIAAHADSLRAAHDLGAYLAGL